MRSFVRVLAYVRPYGRCAVATAVLTIVIAGLGLLAPWPLKILFDSVLGSHPVPSVLVPVLGPLSDDRLLLLMVVVLGGFGVTALENGLKVLNSYLETRLEQGMILNFRSDLFQHAQRLSMAYHDQRRSGALIYAINFQADAAAGLVMTLQPLAHSALTLIGMFWITFRINAPLALLSLVVVPFLYYSVGYYMTHIQDRLRKVKIMEGESLSIIHEAISMMRVIVAFGREKYEHRKFRDQGEQAVDARVKVTVRQTAFSLFVNSTTAAGTAIVLGFGVYQILQGRMTGGDLLVVLSYVASIYSPLESISTTIGSLQDRFISLEIAFRVLDTEPEIQDAPNARPLLRARGRLTFEGVDFSYSERVDTLKDISFDVLPGQVVGVVGPTGAGKSTLVSLIPRFYDVQRGRVLLDGIDIREITLESLRRQISVVLQEPLLFSGTIADNILYARLEATHEEVVEAAKAANAHDFIMRLPKKYQTALGERGVRLSGGERQRISVARAFLKDAPLLILDEPTSSIDSRTEAFILDAIDRLMASRTTFMIAHRLSTIRNPDFLLVMDRGRIIERGLHEELLARGGLYRQLY
ncbi:MAG: ABC transporter ATP-binding protein, partial [Gemmatimonadetes bacterium]|nr:ABC transporter ATP-binding protein [Gemmatimonadota bacterium]